MHTHVCEYIRIHIHRQTHKHLYMYIFIGDLIHFFEFQFCMYAMRCLGTNVGVLTNLYISMYTCVCVHHIDASNPHILGCALLNVCVFVCVCMCVCVLERECSCMCERESVFVYVCVRMFVCAYVCIYLYIHMSNTTHVYVYMHTGVFMHHFDTLNSQLLGCLYYCIFYLYIRYLLCHYIYTTSCV